jgi:antirestriction protein
MVMNISLTPEQYKVLLLTTYLGNWMVNAHQVETDKKFDALASHIYSYAKSFGVAELVELDADSGKYYASKDLEELSSESLDDYDNETFWAELIERLSERDLVAKHGEPAIEKMTIGERFASLDEFEARYDEEFENHGVERLTIKDE